MCDPIPWWAAILKWLGWNVSQEFQVMQHDYQKTVCVWTSGMPTRQDAIERCDKSKGQWVRQYIAVCRD